MFLAKLLLKPTIINRHEWGAEKPRRNGQPMKKEVENLVVTFTGTDECKTKEECIKIVKEVQKRDMEMNGTDIQSNFIVGGDGNIYEGRGFKVAPDYKGNSVDVKGNAFEVAFIGSYGLKPTMGMLRQLAGLVIKAAEEGVLLKDVKKLTPHLLAGDMVVPIKNLMDDDNLDKLRSAKGWSGNNDIEKVRPLTKQSKKAVRA